MASLKKFVAIWMATALSNVHQSSHHERTPERRQAIPAPMATGAIAAGSVFGRAARTQAAILSIGAAKKKAVVNDKGEIVPGDRMWIGMSCDHRVIDGAVGATYLAALKKLLENPAALLL